MSSRRAPRVVVVGAGVGGLSAAIALAGQGCDVTLAERSHAVGGKMAAFLVGGRWVDSGPTVFTMRWVFDELFASVGRVLDDYVTVERADVLARHAWTDGARLDLFADRERSAGAIESAFGSREAEAFLRYCARAQALYEVVEKPFLRSQRPDLRALFGHARKVGMGAFRIGAFRTMAQSIDQTFRDPRLRQLFGRYATYCGASPYEAPATLNVVAHVEQLGVYRIRGGMRALAEALAKVTGELGVSLRLGAEVARIEKAKGRACAVSLREGERIEADAVVFNGDIAALDGTLRGAARASRLIPRPSERSFSAMTFAALGAVCGFPLLHHNVFFGPDPKAEFHALTRCSRLGNEPTVYVCAQDRGDREEERDEDALLLIVNAPPTGSDAGAWTDEVKKECEQAALSTLSRCGMTLTLRAMVTTSPADFHSRFPATSGALYGPRARGALSALRRSGARSTLQGLYLAGGSVHPGPGVPMAALSGCLAASQLVEDLGSTRPSTTEAISGTTWMR